MSDKRGQPAPMAPSTVPPREKESFAALKREARNKKSSISTADPSKSAPPLESDRAFFSPWTWKFPEAMASSSSEETKKNIVIEGGSYFHFDLHKLVALSKILSSLKEKMLGKDFEQVPGKRSEKMIGNHSEKLLRKN